MVYPRRSQTVHVETLNDELCLYDWQRKEVHAMNPTAAQVWQLCDGKTSPAQIAAQLRTRLGAELDAPQAESLVWNSLTQLDKAHLLEGVVTPPGGQSLLTRRQMIKAGIALALLPVISSILAPTPVAAQSGHGLTIFNFTGAPQTFIVPALTTTVVVLANGARGGNGGLDGLGAGLGGRVQATIPVTPGETLNVYVGGQGGTGTGGGSGAGGFNGGGAGGAGTLAGGGGGASDIRQGGAALANRVVVAGGGAGPGGSGSSAGVPGGVGGGLIGGAGGPSASATAGGGGTQAAGGAAGTGVANGVAGVLGIGGAGGANGIGSGGGGGGGYYGGGGGGGGAAGGGGGGGSSFTGAGASGITHTQGVIAGNGSVTITW